MEANLIDVNSSVIEALERLNLISNDVLTLYAIDESQHLIGTLTDGDIRRYLLRGNNLDSSILGAINRNYFYLSASSKNMIVDIKSMRQKGISTVPLIDGDKRIIRIYNLNKYKSILPIDAVLMAGGKGERLRPLTDRTPKPLIKIGEKAIIDYNVERLISYGIDNLFVTVNYLKEQIEKHFENPVFGVKVQCIDEPKYLGTIGSVKFITKFYHDVVLIMNSDLFTNIDYDDFYLHFKENNADMSIAAIPYSVTVPYGIFMLQGRDVLGVKEKPTFDYYANAGVYLVKRELLSLIPDNEFYNATDFIDLLISTGLKVIRFPIAGYWIDIGKHEELKRAQDIVKHISSK